MRVLFDAYWWHEGPPSNRAVLLNLVDAWKTTYPSDELILAYRPRRTVECGLAPPPFESLRYRVSPHGVAACTELGILSVRARPDLLVSQNFTPPGVRAVTFVHDVLFQERPTWFTKAELAYFKLLTLTLHFARTVVTSSSTEARRIELNNPFLAGRVKAIGLSVPLELITVPPVCPAGLDPGTPFMLSVGRMNVRKNLRRLANALGSTGLAHPGFPLLVVGSRDGAQESADGGARPGWDESAVRFLGAVTSAELSWLYRNARLFIYPSLGEGYGLPPVEASYFGCPVAVSDIEVMHEILQSRSVDAEYFDPESEAAIAQGVDRALRRLSRAAEARFEPAAEWSAIVESLRLEVR